MSTKQRTRSDSSPSTRSTTPNRDDAVRCPDCESDSVEARHEGVAVREELHVEYDCWTCGAYFVEVEPPST